MENKAEELLQEALDTEGITPGNQEDIRAYLAILRNRHEDTFQHSIRVGILASQMAIYFAKPGVSSRMLLWAGLLHDIGKTLIEPEVLLKTEGFNESDREAMEPHVIYGYNMLRGVHDYTANIIVQHHRFGAQPYPKSIPPVPGFLSTHATVINRAARILALADFFDALMSRHNDKHGKVPLSAEEKRAIYLQNNADQTEFIELLESVGVLNFNLKA